MSSVRRQRIQIYLEVLRAIHAGQENGGQLSLYRVERSTGLTYPRLKICLLELRRAGFLESSLTISGQGYAFLEEVSAKVEPVMVKYGLWRGGRFCATQ